MTYDEFLTALSDMAVKKYGPEVPRVEAFRRIVVEVSDWLGWARVARR
jgi:hypothetical protein